MISRSNDKKRSQSETNYITVAKRVKEIKGFGQAFSCVTHGLRRQPRVPRGVTADIAEDYYSKLFSVAAVFSAMKWYS